jgi:hypothetical protein
MEQFERSGKKFCVWNEDAGHPPEWMIGRSKVQQVICAEVLTHLGVISSGSCEEND